MVRAPGQGQGLKQSAGLRNRVKVRSAAIKGPAVPVLRTGALFNLLQQPLYHSRPCRDCGRAFPASSVHPVRAAPAEARDGSRHRIGARPRPVLTRRRVDADMCGRPASPPQHGVHSGCRCSIASISFGPTPSCCCTLLFYLIAPPASSWYRSSRRAAYRAFERSGTCRLG